MEQELSQKLRSLRAEHGNTQQEVADYLYLDRSTVAYCESGRIQPSIKTLAKLRKLYQLTWDEFLGDVNL